MIKIGLLLFCLMCCITAQNSTPALITVTVTGQISVPATDAVINVGITNRNTTVQLVRTEIDTIAADIIAYLQEEQIANIDIQTSYLSIQPYFSWNNGQQNTIPDYYIGSKGITFTLRDLSNYDNVMSGLYNLGLNQVNSVTYEADGQDDVINLQAKTRAVQNAKDIASAMVAQLGVGLGPVYSISDAAYSPPIPIFQPMAMAMEADVAAGGAAGVPSSGPSISAGSISYSATVTVVFQIAQ